MSAWILMSLYFLVASVAGGSAQDRKFPTPGESEREAIVAAANQAIRTHLKGDPKLRRGDEIPEESWGEAILRLKPLRVRNDRVNVAIVLRDEDGVEEGLYVSIPISSYAPMVGDRFAVLEKLSGPDDRTFGTLYRYKLKKIRPDPGHHRQVP